jgi:hypothetical protein
MAKEKIKKNSDGMKLNNETKSTKQTALESTLNEIKTYLSTIQVNLNYVSQYGTLQRAFKITINT